MSGFNEDPVFEIIYMPDEDDKSEGDDDTEDDAEVSEEE